MSFDLELKAARDLFIVESRELLHDMEDALLTLESDANSADTINAIFRAAHTIKGSSGLFGLDHIVGFTHVVESVLDLVRTGDLGVSPDLIAILLPCRDHIGALIDGVAGGEESATLALSQVGERLLERLRPLLDGKSKLAAEGPKSLRDAGSRNSETAIESGNWHLSLRFGRDSFRNGMDPLAFIRYLGTLGEIVSLTTVVDALPELAEMDAETCYLGFEIDLKSSANKEAIEGVFEFVREDSQITILPPDSRIDDYIELIRSLPEDDLRIGEILVKSGVLTQRELDKGLAVQVSAPPTDVLAEPIGEILVEQNAVQRPIIEAALEKQKHAKEQRLREGQSIRVDAARLDKLIDLVGELVIAGSGARLHASRSGDVATTEAAAEVIRLVEEVRDSALQLRMVPIGTTFSRFTRVVRDVSAELGKEIDLQISGGDTEVDKSVVEKIGDPLMHLVRNAMDHGIEAGPDRIQRGKPAKGTLRLNAYHDSGSIVIEVGDDGGGLNRERILGKAIERGLVPGSASELSDQEIYALIFEPGFSTAEKVSNLSGRGVGMDVVKRNVTALRGAIDVESRAGSGTTMRIRLPLTLAIIDGFLIGVGSSAFVVPLDRVTECVELPADGHGQDYMDLRGEVLPFIRLHDLFDIDGERPRRQNVVVVEHAGVRTGLVVDELMGEFQTVIKPLGRLFSHLQGIGGSTILGSGDVALILDVPSLVAHYTRQQHLMHASGGSPHRRAQRYLQGTS